MSDNLPEFKLETQKILEQIPGIHRDLQAELIGFTIDDLVVRSPVLTGAYRAAHFVGIGADAPTKLVYDSPEHPIPDVDYQPGGQPIFQVPDGSLARAAYEQEKPFQRAVISNDRFYASRLEYGDATMAPRTIYGTAEVASESKATELSGEADPPWLDFDSIGNTLAVHFNTEMANVESSVKIVWDNGPKLTTAPDPRSSEWVRYAWRPARDAAAALGDKFFRGVGLLDIQIFTPLGSGQGRSERIGRAIQAMFRPQRFIQPNIKVTDTSFGNVGETDGWYQTQIRLQIQADELL